MDGRYRSCIDVHLILRVGDRILLGERRDTEHSNRATLHRILQKLRAVGFAARQRGKYARPLHA